MGTYFVYFGTYRKVCSTSPLEAHDGFFRLSMKGKIEGYLHRGMNTRGEF